MAKKFKLKVGIEALEIICISGSIDDSDLNIPERLEERVDEYLDGVRNEIIILLTGINGKVDDPAYGFAISI